MMISLNGNSLSRHAICKIYDYDKYIEQNGIYLSIKRIVCLSVCLSVCVCLSVSMHLHSFQDTKLKFLRQVEDMVGQVVVGLTILRYHREFRNKGLIITKKVNSACIRSFQDTERKLRR